MFSYKNSIHHTEHHESRFRWSRDCLPPHAASGLCLEVPGAGTSDGVQLAQRSCSDDANQTWQLKSSDSGYTLTAAHKNFQVSDFGKLYRSCGNCSPQYGRHVQVRDVRITAPGDGLVGINPNYGDTARLSGVTVYDDGDRDIDICTKYKSVTSGEPSKTGTGPDSTNCLYATSDITYAD